MSVIVWLVSATGHQTQEKVDEISHITWEKPFDSRPCVSLGVFTTPASAGSATSKGASKSEEQSWTTTVEKGDKSIRRGTAQSATC